jgi:CheY-like chemotaxis protein
MPQKVLLVDDDPLMHLLFQRQLERAGYQMISAMDGAEALDIAERELPQIIVMDLMMPEIDGLEAIRRLRKNEATKAIPVIVITANVSSYLASQQESSVCGAAGFLTKPLSPARLLQELQRLMPPLAPVA